MRFPLRYAHSKSFDEFSETMVMERNYDDDYYYSNEEEGKKKLELEHRNKHRIIIDKTAKWVRCFGETISTMSLDKTLKF